MPLAGAASEVVTVLALGSGATGFSATGCSTFGAGDVICGWIASSPTMLTTRSKPAAIAKESIIFLIKLEFITGNPSLRFLTIIKVTVCKISFSRTSNHYSA
jgi:hypothetical protein